MYKIAKFAKLIGVSASTLRNWDKSGKLKPDVISKGGDRYYSDDTLNNYLNLKNEKEFENRKIVLYARVSTKGQNELDRQIENLKQYAYSKGYNFEIITDIGSGINYAKQGLKELIYMINNKMVKKIVILYKDRLIRFGYELIEYLCEINNTEIEIIDNTTTSKEQELTDDLIQIITVFANRLYGSKSKKTTELIGKVKSYDNSKEN